MFRDAALSGDLFWTVFLSPLLGKIAYAIPLWISLPLLDFLVLPLHLSRVDMAFFFFKRLRGGFFIRSRSVWSLFNRPSCMAFFPFDRGDISAFPM